MDGGGCSTRVRHTGASGVKECARPVVYRSACSEVGA